MLIIVRTERLVQAKPEESGQFDVRQLTRTMVLGQRIKVLAGENHIALFASPASSAKKVSRILAEELSVSERHNAALFSSATIRPQLGVILLLVETNLDRSPIIVLVTHRTICTVLPLLYSRSWGVPWTLQELEPGNAFVIDFEKKGISLLKPDLV
ncbi:MAG: hypothetical protein NUV81_04060 [bacterium]|nr:hypothetical protein [bacterium]